MDRGKLWAVTASRTTLPITGLLACVMAAIPAKGSDPTSGEWPKAEPTSIERWRALRFGMFIHWGPVSLTGHEIGWSRGDKTPIETYDGLYKKFNPVKFNADEWVRIAKGAGMKYIVLTTKHHDGFCLWDTKFTDYNIMHTPFGRDVLRELTDSCKREGIAFGAYYSVADWFHPGWPTTSPGGKVKRETSNMDAYETFLQDQTAELIKNYGPFITIWNDVPNHKGANFGKRGADTIKLVRSLQPDILINNRTGDGGDYQTPEQRIGAFQMDPPWESCMTISGHNHWAWGGEADGVKSLAACLEMIIRAAGGDGNILLNVGPRPDGLIDPEQAERLKEIGAWFAKNGESIYGTRGGPWKPTPAVASTRKGDTVFIHVLRAKDGTVELPELPAKMLKAELLTGEKVDARNEGGKLVLVIPEEHIDPIDTIVRLTIDRPAISLPVLATSKD